MGESHPSPATAPDCQSLTEQPGKDLQGFYNLFLAVGALAGIAAVALGQPVVGWTLIFSSCGSMFLAAAALALTGSKYLSAAATQGVTPLLAVVLGILGLVLS